MVEDVRPPRRLCSSFRCHPRWLRARPLRRCGGGHPRRLRPWLPCRGGRVVRGVSVWAGGRRAEGGLGGDQVPHVGVHVVEGLTVVVGVVRWHLLNTGGDCTAQLGLLAARAPCPSSPVRRPSPPPPPVPAPPRACLRWLTSPPPILPLGSPSTTGP